LRLDEAKQYAATLSMIMDMMRHIQPITCEWAWLICIYKYVVGTALTYYFYPTFLTVKTVHFGISSLGGDVCSTECRSSFFSCCVGREAPVSSNAPGLHGSINAAPITSSPLLYSRFLTSFLCVSIPLCPQLPV